VFAFGLLPQIVLFIGQMLVSSDGSMTYARANAEVLWQVPVAVAALAVYYSTIGVAVSSLTTRRIAAAAIFIGLMLVSGAVAGILSEVNSAAPERRTVVPPPPPEGIGPGQSPPDTQIVVVRRANSMTSIVNLSAVPLHVRDLVFLGHLDANDDLGGVDGAGPAVLGLYTLVVSVAAGVTLLRYREAA
jgi:hypothetical protein